jgi:hypothetical protein
MNIDSDQLAFETLRRGVVIPACPLALDEHRKWDERRQRALFRYYRDSGAGGLAVGVHTTQFAIRDPRHGLFEPVLKLAAEELSRPRETAPTAMVRVAGACGPTKTAVAEAEFARDCGYHAVLLNISALTTATDDELITHCRHVAEVSPLFGFYLNPAIGGRALSYRFWRRFAEIERVVAIKIAPFNRYQTIDVVRAVVEAGRDDIALYTGNDDNILLDLLTPFRFERQGVRYERRIVGGLLAQWAVGTRRAVELLAEYQRATSGERASNTATAAGVPLELLRIANELTDADAALFDAANGFVGCTPGVMEVLRRQGLLQGNWCLNPRETLSPGQSVEIDRVYRAYPELFDDAFVRDNLDRWLSDA